MINLTHFSRSWVVVLLLVDLAGFLISAYIASAIVDHTWAIGDFRRRFEHSSFVFVVIWVLIFERLGLYRKSFALSTRDELYYTIVALTLGVLPQLALFTVVPTLSTSRLVLIIALVCAVFLVGGARGTLHFIHKTLEKRKPRRIAVLGGAENTLNACDLQYRDGTRFFDIPTCAHEWDSLVVSAPETVRSWLEKASALNCDTMLVTKMFPPIAIPYLLEAAGVQRIRVAFLLPELKCSGYSLGLEKNGDHFLLTPSKLPICKPSSQLFKRLFDCGVASIIVLVSLPIAAAAALAVWLETGKPILYKQRRVGRHGRVFEILKFRTMRPSDDTSWAKRGDDRITKVGAVLRRTSIDELPQLFNVLRGEMSLIGPRPEMESFVDDFSLRLPRYAERHLVSPGITGWSQVNYKRVLTPDDALEVLRRDLFYIEHWSPYMDASILFKTLVEFLFHETA